MAHRGLTRGTPLRTLALLLSNRQDLIYEASLAATAAAAGGVLSPTAAAAGPGPTPPGSAGTAGRPSSLNPAAAQHARAPGGPLGGVLMPGGGSGVAAAMAGGGLLSPTGGSGSFGFFSPGAGPQADALLTHWRENLAVMAANRTAGGVEAMMRLGDLLLSQQGQVGVFWGLGLQGFGVRTPQTLLQKLRELTAHQLGVTCCAAAQVCVTTTAALLLAALAIPLLVLCVLLQVDAAHVCYLVAGVTPTPIDAGPAARMLLLGLNHNTVAGQQAMRQLLPLMRSEVYEWARSLAGESPALGGVLV